MGRAPGLKWGKAAFFFTDCGDTHISVLRGVSLTHLHSLEIDVNPIHTGRVPPPVIFLMYSWEMEVTGCFRNLSVESFVGCKAKDLVHPQIDGTWMSPVL